MPSDFSAMGKSAISQLPVPEISMETIRSRSRAATLHSRFRTAVACGAICVAAVGTGIGFGQQIYDGVRVWLSGGNAAVAVRSFAMVREPMAADLRKAVQHATFPVVLPVGIPRGTHIRWIAFSPAEHPSFFTLDYHSDRAHFHVGFSLFDSTAVNTGQTESPMGSAMPHLMKVDHWQIGRETVVVVKRYIARDDAARIKEAMMKASPAQSLAATESMLSRITITWLGAPQNVIDRAQRLAPGNGRSVLIGPSQILQFSTLVKKGRPLLDPRTVFANNVPSAHGVPQYSKAILHWPRVAVVPVRGVQAIDAVLRSTGNGRRCRCAILFNQPSKATYWIWKIPLSNSGTAKKYSVDAKTLAEVDSK